MPLFAVSWYNISLSKRNKDDIFFVFADNIDTRSVLDALRDIVADSNVYLRDNKSPNNLLLRDIAVYITRILSVFGAISGSQETIGFPISDDAGDCNNVSIRYRYIIICVAVEYL